MGKPRHLATHPPEERSVQRQRRWRGAGKGLGAACHPICEPDGQAEQNGLPAIPSRPTSSRCRRRSSRRRRPGSTRNRSATAVGRKESVMPLRALGCATALVSSVMALLPAHAADCPVTHDQLVDVLKKSVKPSGGPGNGGLDNNEWAAVVTREGAVCAVAFSGAKPDDQWLGSRAIAAEKANTANALSLQKFALLTANLYAGAQP